MQPHPIKLQCDSRTVIYVRSQNQIAFWKRRYPNAKAVGRCEPPAARKKVKPRSQQIRELTVGDSLQAGEYDRHAYRSVISQVSGIAKATKRRFSTAKVGDYIQVTRTK